MSEIKTAQSFLEFIKDERKDNGNLSTRGVARCCGVADKSLINGGSFNSAKLSQKLEGQGFRATHLIENGWNAEASWVVVNYFAIVSKAKSPRSKELYSKYLNLPYSNYFTGIHREKRKKPQELYLIHSKEAECVKIGISNNPKRRLKDLQTSFPYELKLIKTIKSENARKLEKSLHLDLDDFRLRGEWFSDEFLNYCSV